MSICTHKWGFQRDNPVWSPEGRNFPLRNGEGPGRKSPQGSFRDREKVSENFIEITFECVY